MFYNGHGDVVCRFVEPARVVAGSAIADAAAVSEQEHVPSMKKTRKARTNLTSDVRGGDVLAATPSQVSYLVGTALPIVYAMSIARRDRTQCRNTELLLHGNHGVRITLLTGLGFKSFRWR